MNRAKCHVRSFEEEYVVLEQIGQGAYGRVYKATKAGMDKLFAVKLMRAQAASISSLREIKLLRELSHPYIVKLRDQFVNLESKSLALVYDYAESDLRKVIWEHKRMKKPIAEDQIRLYMFQLLHAVKYLHDNWILHRDIKPENILIERAPRGGRETLKLCDFGLARIFQSPVAPLSDVERVVATLWYRAPELLLGSRHYTTAVDMWAVGCIFGELHKQQQLFPGQQVKKTESVQAAPFQERQCRTIFKVLGVPNEAQWPGVSLLPHYKSIAGWRSGFPSESFLPQTVTSMSDPLAIDLLSKLLEMDQAKRITAESALKHEFFAGIDEEARREAAKATHVQYQSAFKRSHISAPASMRVSDTPVDDQHPGAGAGSAEASAE